MTDLTTRDDVRQAVRRGADFLLDGRDEEGWWWDYDLKGASDDWITAYVAGVLVGLGDPDLRAPVEHAMELLVAAQNDNGGWSYNEASPSDGDSTAWVLRLAAVLGRSGEPWALRGREFLGRHVHADGLVATYDPELAAPVLARYPMVPSWDAWCDGHECVTAAAAGVLDLPERDRVVAALLAGQLPTGQWPAYWWVDQELTTALACEALRDVPGSDFARAAAAHWAAERIGPDGAVGTELHPEGSPFATALALRILLAAEGDEHARERSAAAAWLVRAQSADGSWLRSARLRMPLPWDAHPDAYADWTFDGVGRQALGTIARDTMGRHTTATVVQALQAVANRS